MIPHDLTSNLLVLRTVSIITMVIVLFFICIFDLLLLLRILVRYIYHFVLYLRSRVHLSSDFVFKSLGFLAVMIAFLVQIHYFFSINYSYFSDLYTFPYVRPVLHDFGSLVDYVLGDYGLPNIPYRLYLALISQHNDALLTSKGFSALFALAIVLLIYLSALRFVRPLIALILSLLFMQLPLFYFSLYSLRGYSFSVFVSLLSLYAFVSYIKTCRPGTILIWFISSFLTILSNPVYVLFLLAQAYFIFWSSAADNIRQRMFRGHYIAMALAFVCLCPIVLIAAEVCRGEAVDYEKLSLFSGLRLYSILSAIVFLYIFVRLRRNILSIYFISYSLMSFALILLMTLSILPAHDHYFISVMPLNFICIGILFEMLLSKKEAHGGVFLRVILTIAGMTLLVANFILVYGTIAEKMKPENQISNDDFRRIERVIHSKNKPLKPILFYSRDKNIYYQYLMFILNIEPFYKAHASYTLKNISNSGDESFYKLRNYYYIDDSSFDDPCEHIDAPFVALYFDSKDMRMPVFLRQAKCGRMKYFSDMRVSIWSCNNVCSKKGGFAWSRIDMRKHILKPLKVGNIVEGDWILDNVRPMADMMEIVLKKKQQGQMLRIIVRNKQEKAHAFSETASFSIYIRQKQGSQNDAEVDRLVSLITEIIRKNDPGHLQFLLR